MKIFRNTLIIMAAMVSAVAQAQVDRTFAFVDENGKEIANGATVTANKVEVKGSGADTYEVINSGVYVKNLTNEQQHVGAELRLTRLDNGATQCCFPISCIDTWGSNVGDYYKSSAGDIPAGETKTISTEWFPDTDGTATVTVKLNVYDMTMKNQGGIPTKVYKERDVFGPTITINFVKGATAVNGVTANDNVSAVAYYTADGQRLAQPQRGLNIVLMSDGTTRKIMR